MTTIEPTVAPVAAIDPANLQDFEREAIEEFVATARANGDDPTTCLEVRGCGLFLIGEAAEVYGADLPCLAVAKCELGNWSALFRRPGRTDSLLVCQFIGGRDVY